VLAVIIGIVMINIVGDDGSTAKASGSTTTVGASTSTAPSTTASTGGNKTTTTTAHTRAVIPPKSLRIIVVNSGAPSASGGPVSDALRTHGYTNQVTTKKVTFKQPGLTVFCKPGLEREAAALVKALPGIPHYPAKSAAWKQQPGIPADVNCYVAIGAVA